MFKRLREEWVYWRFRNITRRWLKIKSRWQSGRRAAGPSPTFGRARGVAAFPTSRSGSNNGLMFVIGLSLVLAVINTALGYLGMNLLDAVLTVAACIAYMRMARV